MSNGMSLSVAPIRRAALLTGVAAATLACGLAAAPAVGQAPAGAQAEAAEPSLEVITVTARKREEALTDVPAAVTVLDAEALQRRLVDDAADLLRTTATAQLVSTGPDYLSDISIRGQGGGRQQFSESATGIYRNGIYNAGGGFGGRSLTRLDLFDLERIEILRGPQGALYGRNAVGGAINVVAARPGDEFEGFVGAIYDEFERVTAEGAVNLPLAEGFAVRLAGFTTEQDEGWIENGPGEGFVDAQSYDGARASARWSVTPDWALTATAEYYESEAPGFAALGYREEGFPYADTVAAFLPPGVPFEFILPGFPSVGVPDPAPDVSGGSRVGVVEIEETNFFLESETSFGFADLTLVALFKQRDGARLDDDLDNFIGFEGLADLFEDQTEDYDRFGLEARLTSTGDGPVSWLIGADLQSSESDVERIYGGTPDPLGVLLSILNNQTFNEKLLSYSVFGSLEVALTDRLDLTLEARATRDEKEFAFSQVSLADGSTISYASDPVWEDITPGASVNFALDERSSLYARIATATRPGGFNTGINDVDAENLRFIQYDPEYAASAEAGWRTRLFDDRLSLSAAVYYTYTFDVQVVTELDFGDTTAALFNAGDQAVWGLELEAQGLFEVGPGTLLVSGGLASNDGEFEDGAEIIYESIPVDLSGLRVNRTRDYALTLDMQYRWPIGPELTLFAGGGLQTEGGGFEEAVSAAAEAPELAGVSVPPEMDDFTTFDLRVGADYREWRLSIFAENVGDERYRVQEVLDNAYFNQPRRVGADLRWRF